MAIITYTSGTMTVGGETFDLADLADLGVEMVRFGPAVVHDRSCEVCGAKDLTFADGSRQFEACFPYGHALERRVGVNRCLCGHPMVEHDASWSSCNGACMLCDALGESCDRYRPSVKRRP